MSKKIKFDPFPTTVLPFVYNSKEWDEPPINYLGAYMRENNIKKYKISHKGDIETGYLTSIILCGHKIIASSYFETKIKAIENIAILALLNCIGYCDTADDLQKLFKSVCSHTKSKTLSKSYDSIFFEEISYFEKLNNCEHNNCREEVTFLPKVGRLSIMAGNQSVPMQDENLWMDRFEIDGIIFEADKEMVTVNSINISCLEKIPAIKIVKLEHDCYEIPYKFYEKNMGRASWVFNLGKNEEPVYIHPSIIFANKKNSIQMEYVHIPTDKSLKDYHIVNYHFVVLFPLANEF